MIFGQEIEIETVYKRPKSELQYSNRMCSKSYRIVSNKYTSLE